MANRCGECVRGSGPTARPCLDIILAVRFLTLQIFSFITFVYVFIMMTLGFDYCHFLPSLILPGEGVD